MSRRAAVRAGTLSVLALVALGAAAFATDGVGALFELGVSARSLGVGGARAAFFDEAAAATLNPASAARVETIGVGSLYVAQFGGVSYGSASFSAPCVGMSAAFLDSGWIPTEEAGLRLTAQAMTASAALPLGPISLGLKWDFLRYGAPFDGHGWAVDAGLLVDLGAVDLGLVCDALVSAPMMLAHDDSETWARDLRLGAAGTWEPLRDVACTVTIDVRGVLAGPWRLVGGIEAWAGPMAARLGWDGDGPTLGLSVRAFGVEADWSCAARSDLGVSHRVSLMVLF